MLLRMWSNRNCHSWLMGMQHGATTLQGGLAVSCKTKHTLTIRSRNLAPWYLPKVDENLCPHKNLHMYLIAALFMIAKLGKATKLSFSWWWISKLWRIQTIEYYSELKRNELSSHGETQQKLKFIFLSERSPSENAIYCMIPSLWHSGKGKTIETVKNSACQGLGEGDKGWISGGQVNFRAVKLFCMIL